VIAGRPVPTRLAVMLFAAGLFPAILSIIGMSFFFLALALDAAILILCALDYAWAPAMHRLSIERRVEPILSSGIWNPVRLHLEATGKGDINGELRDGAPLGVDSEGHRQKFHLDRSAPRAELMYRIRPLTRGDLHFGDLHLRLIGALGLCARQQVIPLADRVKVYPDLSALSQDALALARSSEAPSARALRKPSEGREFESLREYREGDDFRTIDWKATARRARTMVRVHQPDRNQAVIILIDCGRHMAGKVKGRRKLDHAVDAALRLAKVSLDKGDLVGAMAFATQVHSFLPPRKGREHLRAIITALYRVEAALEESDYSRAIDLAFARHHKRSLVVILTDLLDADSSAALLKRVLSLRPRHLPLIVSLLDEDLQQAATGVPQTVHEAYVREAANRLDDEYKLTAARLRNAGALLLRAPARRLSAAAVNEYLRVKGAGLL